MAILDLSNSEDHHESACEAEKLLLVAAARAEAAFGAQSPRLVAILSHLACAQSHAGNITLAEDSAKRALALSESLDHKGDMHLLHIAMAEAWRIGDPSVVKGCYTSAELLADQ